MFGDTVTWTGIPRVFTGPNMGDGAGQSFGTFTNSEGVAFASIIASFSPYPSDAIQYSAEFWPLWQDFFLADPSSCPTPGAPTCLYNNVAYAEAAADALFKPLGEGGIGLLYTSINIDPAPWFMASQYSSYCHAYSSDTVSLGTACFKPPTSPTNYQAILTRALGTYTEVLNYIQSAYPQVQIHFSPVPSISLWNTCKLTTAASRTEAAVEACFGPLYQTMVANVATARVTALHEPAGAWALFCGACPFLSSPANVDTFLQNASTAIKTVSPSTKVGAGGAYPDMGISGGVYTCPNTGGSLNYWCDYTTVDASFLDYVGMDLYPATNTSASYAALVGTPSGGMSGGLAATYTSMAQAAQAAHLPIYINESSALRWSFPGTGPGTTPGAESDTYLGSGWSGWTVTNAWSDWLAAVPVAWAEYMGIVGWDYIDTPALTCQSTDPNNTHTCPDCTQTQTGTPLPDTFMPTCMASLPSVSTYGTMYGTLASRNPFAAQTVAFGPLSDQPFGTAPFPVGATASSGLAVSFASITPAVCTISGATVTLVAAGTCAIRATQAGNTIYAAAPPVYQSFQVTAASQTIAFGALANQPYGSASFPVGATATSGLAVSFASTTAAVCTVSGATVTLVSAGTCTIQATQAGNANYAAATPVSQSFQVTAASQTIAFGALANQPYGSASFPVSATATSGLAVSFASTTPACTMSGATVTLVSVGTCTIQATQAGNNNYAPATPVNQSFSVTQEGQAITFGPLTDQVLGSAPITVNATASSGLPVAFASITPAVCTVSGNTVTLAGAGQCSIQAVQPGNLSYLAAAPVTQSFQAAQETLGIASLTVASAGGSDSVEIGFLPQLAAPSWSATANAAWLHLGSGSGTGAAILAFSCDPNPSTTVRSGAITLDSGVALTVTQAGSDYMGPGAAVALASAGLSGPVAVAVDGSGNVYLADTGNNAIKEWSAATQQVTTLVSTGLNQPAAVAVDNSGNVYIADTGNHAIKQWNATTQQVTALVSTGLNQPVGVAVDGSGNVYIADSLNNAIEVWNAMTQQVTALVSTGLNQPVGVAVDGSGNVYIADSLNDAIEEWSAATQQVTTLVSTGVNQPAGVAVDGSGNVYMAYSKSAAIAEWSAATQQVTTLVSTGLQQPVGVAVDGSGNVYIADAGNNAVEEIPWVFVGPASLTEPVTGGTDALLPVLPATTSLVGIFAPASNQGWLSIGSVANGVVGFSFTANSSTAARTAQINVLGQQIAVTQNGLTVQTIAFGALANQPYGSAPFPVSATATAGLAVSFASTTPACTVSGATVTLVSAGTCTIQATQAGNANYAAATPVSQSFQVTAASQTIAFGALANQPYGSAPFPVGATATSGLAVSFASTTPACAMSGATVSLVSAGTCTIQATQAGNANYAAATPVSQSFQVTAASQTIAFGALANQPYGSAPFPVGATASSGLAVSFASTTRAVCTVSGATVTLAAGGTCTIQATQAGNANYAAATPVNQTFQVTPASQTITFGVLANQPLGTSPFPVSATASSGLAVSFASTTPSVCTVSSATVTLVAAGTCTIQARQAGNANYAAATPVNQSFQVQRSQTITFGALSNRAFGSAPFTVSATASSGLAVSFASTTSAVCTTSGATVTLAAAGTCTIQATQAGNTNYAAATPVNQSFQVTQASQTITFGALSNRAFGSAPFTVSATASSGLAVSFASTTSAVCTTSGATVTLVAAGTCTIQATQAGNANYAAATPVNRSFQVTPKSQTIAFGALSNRAFGSAPFTVSATASSGLAVSFASTTSAVCTTSGATVTLVAAGTCTIQATQAGNANWTAATPVNQSFQVTPASQTITFGALSKRAFGSAPFTVSATASSGLAVSFASTTSAVCTTSGATVTLAAAGTCTIQATQAGNANYAAATPVSQSFQVTPASQTITFGALSNRAFGSAPFAVAATASSGLAVSFNSQTTKVCGVSGTTVTLLATGACTIQATQAGNANWAAATPVNQSFQVTQGSQTITFGALSNQTLGTPPFTVSATASSGFAVSFASATTAVCTVSGSTVTLVAAGTCTIKATQPGNANWAAATPVNQSFQVK
jgi:streptogramin lyase